MSETRKIAAILVSDVVGYSRLAGADEDRTLARLRALRSDLIDPTISVQHGRIVKRTGDDPGLFAASGRPCAGKARDRSEVGHAEKSVRRSCLWPLGSPHCWS
jgi:class 3 adenylate cyclase